MASMARPATRASGTRPRAGPRIGPMRRESSTVVVVTGDVGEDLLTGLARSANVSVARAPADGPKAGAGTGGPAGADTGSGPPPGWQAG